jgi:hypothetical protein
MRTTDSKIYAEETIQYNKNKNSTK